MWPPFGPRHFYADLLSGALRDDFCPVNHRMAWIEAIARCHRATGTAAVRTGAAAGVQILS
jgi:hypothetical protein